MEIKNVKDGTLEFMYNYEIGKDGVVTLPDSITRIGDNAFTGKKNLVEIIIPDSVTSIGQYAFSICKNLRKVIIPKSVTSIGNGAFAGCTSLTDIQIDKENPSYHMEGGCLIENDTKTVVWGRQGSIIPSSAKIIGVFAFAHDDNLVNITIPNNIITIGEYAFYKCTSLTDIEIPNSVIEIGVAAFGECSELTTVELGKKITKLNKWAFFNCKKLIEINYNGTEAQWRSIKKGQFWHDAVPSDCTIYCEDGIGIPINEADEASF